MNDNYVYITLHQGYALTTGIERCKKNPYFKDEIAESFVKEVHEQSIKITVRSLDPKRNLLQKIWKDADKIKISKSKLAYVMKLTGIDIFDEKTMNWFMAKTSEAETAMLENKQKSR